ncbi:MAG TPA: replication-associated recombination protein A, partial [Polyangiaceae bacterium]
MARRSPPRTSEPTLLEAAAQRGALGGPPAPLADRMRPRSLEDVLGQETLLSAGKLLREAILADRVPSLILWGPPGSGKTTLAHVISRATKSEFVAFSAVLGGVQELRAIIEQARERRAYQGRATILFVDEIHRFNRSQQDAFLPHVESGTVTLIGATTENPSFSVNAAVLSRCRVFRLEALSEPQLVVLLERALSDAEHGLGARSLHATAEALQAIAKVARGDARRALGLLEATAAMVPADANTLDLALVERAGESHTLLYDKSGEEHYNVTSALIKSLRGSDPDAALYWLLRMQEAGDDPLFLLRRLIIFASEDVGNADPRALEVALNADTAFRRIGMPEGVFPLAHACLYLASCPKSNAVKAAIEGVKAAIQ